MQPSSPADTIARYTPSDWGSIIAILMAQAGITKFDITLADMEALMRVGSGVRIELASDGLHFQLVTPDECRAYVEKHPDTVVFGDLLSPPSTH